MRWVNNFINVGVTTETSFEEARRIRMANIIGITGLLSSTVFFISNFNHDRKPLAILNVITMASMAALMYVNYNRLYAFGHVIISIVLSLVFAITGLLYHNGMEFYLLIIAAIVMTISRRNPSIQIIYIVNCLVFIFLLWSGDMYQFFPPVPKTVYSINVTVWVLFYVIFFWYFRKLSRNNQVEIETRNRQLQQQQIKLIEQTRQLEVNNRQLEVLNSTKEKLFSIVAHDVRSPIAGLKTTLDLFNENILTKEEFMELSKELSMQLNQLHWSLENLLKWSNSQMQGIEIQKQKIFLEPLIADTLSLLQYNLVNKNIQTNISSEGNSMIDADPDHIKIVIRNLISNAIKFSYAGGKIDLVIEKIGSFIHFSVIDNGLGMKEETIQELFLETSIKSSRGTSNEKGTGMGLKLSKEFAEKNGGSITVECEPDMGCAFTLIIPAATINNKD
ncbi:sensor histidine kinase [Niabella ginsengisoli]|uniref:histidine kinase n=1 Tax=Niabella ginsengisoli TaxID=522298 RepID=A0ABS9SRA6_9BACT|nr:HAMP domain-containing sensor histidine kinase [Niabella ginsengisoli]MCH5600927.1 HAMP domain-containing histidine kinase [Niabella ginsengisoli]